MKDKHKLKQKNTVMMSLHYKENIHLVKQIVKMSKILEIMVRDSELMEDRPHLFNLLIEGPIEEMREMIDELNEKSARMLEEDK